MKINPYYVCVNENGIVCMKATLYYLKIALLSRVKKKHKFVLIIWTLYLIKTRTTKRRRKKKRARKIRGREKTRRRKKKRAREIRGREKTAEEKRKEQERLEEERRIAEEKRLAEEKILNRKISMIPRKVKYNCNRISKYRDFCKK